ncbi:MAG: hypothetical protein SRB2_01919 [Desulfobacteraceae bacterium Eth-SRB2]|nr:MAG: hypothetical protein SRB2_01919 [Desulfobacteraceae bacterium Eth-SRB2]
MLSLMVFFTMKPKMYIFGLLQKNDITEGSKRLRYGREGKTEGLVFLQVPYNFFCILMTTQEYIRIKFKENIF